MDAALTQKIVTSINQMLDATTAKDRATSGNTVVNFDCKEVLDKAKRVQTASQICSSTDGFNFVHREKKIQPFIPVKLPEDSEINQIVLKAWHKVKETVMKLGIVPGQLPPKVNLTELKVQSSMELPEEDEMIEEENFLLGETDSLTDPNVDDDEPCPDFLDNLKDLINITQLEPTDESVTNLRE